VYRAVRSGGKRQHAGQPNQNHTLFHTPRLSQIVAVRGWCGYRGDRHKHKQTNTKQANTHSRTKDKCDRSRRRRAQRKSTAENSRTKLQHSNQQQRRTQRQGTNRHPPQRVLHTLERRHRKAPWTGRRLYLRLGHLRPRGVFGQHPEPSFVKGGPHIGGERGGPMAQGCQVSSGLRDTRHTYTPSTRLPQHPSAMEEREGPSRGKGRHVDRRIVQQ